MNEALLAIVLCVLTSALIGALWSLRMELARLRENQVRANDQLIDAVRELVEAVRSSGGLMQTLNEHVATIRTHYSPLPTDEDWKAIAEQMKALENPQSYGSTENGES
jgi:hypothetical protein